MKKPANYWKSFSNLKKELKPFISKHKRLPSYRELRKAGMESMSRNGIMFHGGALKVAKKLNIKTYDQFIGRAEADYWTYKKTVTELKKYISKKKMKYFPTKGILIKDDRNDLLGAIRKFGRNKFVKENSIKVKRIKKGNKLIFERPPKILVRTMDDIVNELRDVIEELGYFPMGSKLDKMGKSDLRGAIQRQGGQLAFWDKLGQPRRRNPKYKYRRAKRNLSQVTNDYKFLSKKLGHPPSETELWSLDKYDLLHDIKLHFKSVINLCDYIGYDENLFGMYKTRAGNFVRSIGEAILDNIMSYLKVPHIYEGIIDNKAKKKYKYDFKIKDLNKNDVYIELWGYQNLRRSDKGIFEQVVKNYQIKKQKKRRIYKNRDLKLIEIEGRDITGSSIVNAYEKVAKIFLKNNVIKKIPKLDTFKAINFLIFKLYDLKVFETELKNAQKNFGYMPSYQKLIKSGYSSLAGQIMKLGGFPLIRKKFKLKSKLN